MICTQCGALVEDAAEICENCGMILNAEAEEVSSDRHSVNLPALSEEDGNLGKSFAKKNTNLFVKWVSVICAVVCFVTFMMAATTVESSIVVNQTPSVFGGLFGSSQASLPAELARALGYAFTGMAFAFSGLILITGFKKK